MPVRSLCKLLSSLVCLLLVVACESSVRDPATFTPASVSATFDLDYAAYGETNTIKFLGANSNTLSSITVAGVEVPFQVRDGNIATFQVPSDVPAGQQQVIVEYGTHVAHHDLYVLGDDVDERQFMLVLAEGTTLGDLDAALEDVDYNIVEGPFSLGGSTGVCSGDRVLVEIYGLDTGKALTELSHRGSAGLWSSDPMSGYSSGTVDHLGAIGALAPRLHGLAGSGTVIAVVDTGVSPHAELGSRLLTAHGHDFVDLGTAPEDDFPGGHGTPIAVLSAGTLSGVAPSAQVLPVRVCDEDGHCRTDDILAGICHAMAVSEDRLGGMDNLVLSLSFGGETPVSAIGDALAYALDNGALVVSSAGNEGLSGSPAQYPAAFDLPGLVAVGALTATPLEELLGTWRPADFSTRGSYVDIAAPGSGLRSGSPDGLYRTDYSGTSYATALAAGALALWRESQPSATAAEIENGLKAAAKPLPYPEDAVGAGMLDLSQQPR